MIKISSYAWSQILSRFHKMHINSCDHLCFRQLQRGSTSDYRWDEEKRIHVTNSFLCFLPSIDRFTCICRDKCVGNFPCVHRRRKQIRYINSTRLTSRESRT